MNLTTPLRLLVTLIVISFLAVACSDDDDPDPDPDAGHEDTQPEADTEPDEEDADHEDVSDNDETVEPFSEDCTVGLEPGEDATSTYQAAIEVFVNAEPGDVICFNDGDYSFNDQLSLTASDVEIRGESRDNTRLDFSAQDAGSNGIDVEGADNFTIRSLSVLNTPGNGIEVRSSSGVHFDDLVVEWEGEPTEDNGAYGLYPVMSDNITIENSRVFGSSDAGIYLGQSEYGIIHNNEVHGNVAGIEVENSTHIDVYENVAYDNTGGILVFNLPELQRKEGRLTRVFDNEVYDNNRENFAAEGAIVGLVPRGSGVLIIAVQEIEVFDNQISNHDSLGVAAISFDTLPQVYDDDEYNPYVEKIDVHSNIISDSGADPDELAAGLTGFDAPLPAVIWDGVINDEVPEEDRLNCFSGNVDDAGAPVTYGNFGAEEGEEFELGPNDCSHDPLPEVELGE